MSLSVNFNGTSLVKPGAASRVISRLQSFGVAGTGVLALLGTADSGPPGLSVFTSPETMKATYRSGDLADAADAAFKPSNDPRIQGGPSAVYAYKLNPSTQATLSGGLSNNTPLRVIDIVSRYYGLISNRISFAYDAGLKQATVLLYDGLNSIREVSPVFSGERMQIRYTGGGSACSATVAFTTDTAGTLTTSVTDGPGGENLNLDLALFATLGDLVTAINAHPSGAYVAGLLDGTNPAAPSYSLDRATYADIRTAMTTVTGLVQEIIDWCNNESQLVSASRTDAARTGAPVSKAATMLTGGALGAVPDVTALNAAIAAIKAQRVHAVVPLISADVATGVTMLEVLAAMLAYAADMNSTTGRNEVEVYLGYDATKADVKVAAASLLNNPHLTLSCQKHTLRGAAGTLKSFPAWSSALLYAAMRCASPIGEPITFKYVRSFGLAQDATIVLPDHVNELLLAGVTLYEQVPGKGIRLIKGNTTYTRTDDDAYTEESVVSVWKAIAYDLRQTLEDRYTGTKGLPATVSSVEDTVGAKLEEYRKAEALTDSQDENGTPLHAWREVKVSLDRDVCAVSATITVAQGINFILPTIHLAPVKLTA